MERADFIRRLQAAGYDTFLDPAGVVTIRVDPTVKNADELRRLIKDKIGWNQSYGIKYIKRPPAWDESPRSGPRGRRRPKAPDRDALISAKASRARKAEQAAADDQLEGQLSFEDCFSNMFRGKEK